MKLMKQLAICVFALFVIIPVSADDAKLDPQETPEAAITEGISLLEEKKYEAFVKRFIKPDDLAKITEKMPLGDLAKGFGERKAPAMLLVLKEVKDVKPTMNEAGTTATYALKEAVAGKESFSLVKIDKLWYIEN
jgi:hypothetical protein